MSYQNLLKGQYRCNYSKVISIRTISHVGGSGTMMVGRDLSSTTAKYASYHHYMLVTHIVVNNAIHCKVSNQRSSKVCFLFKR